MTWKKLLRVREFDKLFQIEKKRDSKAIQLLVLSACETADGDKRAALGLAGVAIRSGARSTLATLWSVQDNSTAKLITEFYRFFTQTGTSKAEALRQAQLSLLKNPKYQHPYYWSPFVLVGNWQ